MIFPIAGTIRNTVKLAELDSKWQQRKNNIGKEPLDATDFQIRAFKEDLQRMRENEKVGYIDSKLESGMGLTPDEIEYLKKNYPEKYKEYLEVKKEKEAFENQVKTCKTKEDVERLKFTKINGYLAEAKSITNNPNIPKGKKLAMLKKLLKKSMGIEKVYQNFVKSMAYKNLPTDEERAEEIKERNNENSGVEEITDKEEQDTRQEDGEETDIPAEFTEEEPIKVKPEGAKPEKTSVKLEDLRQQADYKLTELKLELHKVSVRRNSASAQNAD